MRYKIGFWIIILIAAAVRFWGLSDYPPALNWDEISHGYNAYSLLKTGQDEWGQAWPIFNFRAYGDYPTTLYMYLTMPWIILFGLNEFSIRFTSALAGVLLAGAVFFLSKRLTGSQAISLMAALFVSISPWTVMISRQVIQASPAVLFLTLGLGLILQGIRDKNRIILATGTIALGLSAYAYHNTRIFAPLLFFLVILIYRHKIWELKKIFLPVLMLGFLLFAPLVPAMLSSEGSARAQWVGILDQGAINSINEARTVSNLSDPFPRMIYNKLTYFTSKALTNYVGYFSPDFLFFKGGTHYQFSIPGWGLVSPVLFPFFYIGLFHLFRTVRKSSEKQILLSWLLLAPIPAAITRDPYQVVRGTTMIPVVFIITALGLQLFAKFLYKVNKKSARIFTAGALILVLVFTYRYLTEFTTSYSRDYSFAWQYGYKDAVEYVKNAQDKYFQVVISKKYGEAHEFFLFYLQYDPQKYRNDPNLVRYFRSNWYWVDSFDKYRFINDWEVKMKTENMTNTLLITSPGNFNQGATLIKTIFFLDGQPAFDIVEL